MHKIKKIKLYVFILLFISILFGQNDTLLTDISNKYLNRIPFELDINIKTVRDNKDTSKVYGGFILRDKNSFKVNYPGEKILYDGKWLWSKNKNTNQTVVEEFKPSSSLSLIYDVINGNLSNYNADAVEENNNIKKIALTPKGGNNFFKNIELTIDTSYSIQNVEYTDFKENKTLIEFNNIEDVEIHDSTYYDISQPKKENLIDLRP